MDPQRYLTSQDVMPEHLIVQDCIDISAALMTGVVETILYRRSSLTDFI